MRRLPRLVTLIFILGIFASVGGLPGAMPLVPSPAMAAADNPVVESWDDGAGRNINLRKDQRTKIIDKHNLTIAVVRKVTQRTKRVLEPGSATVYIYAVPARRYVCGIWNCTVVETRDVRVAVDFRTRPQDSRQMGVLSAYCPIANKEPVCPDWVKTAL